MLESLPLALRTEKGGGGRFWDCRITLKSLESGVQYYLYIMPTLGFFGIMAGWHYGEGGDSGLWIYDS